MALTNIDHPRILVIGAGVNGSAIASCLHRGGVDVTVLARGKRFDELLAEGIIIENPFNQQRTITNVPVIDRLLPDDIYDYVLVVVRKNQAFGLLPLLAQNQSRNIVFLGNNLLGPGEFISVLGNERVMMGSVFAAGKRDGNLIRAMIIKSVPSPLGEINGSLTPRLKQLRDILRQAGFKVKLSEDIAYAQLAHGVGVVLIAKLVLKHGGSVRRFAQASDDLRLFVAARREGIQLLQSLGHKNIGWSERIIEVIPTFLQVLATRMVLNSRMGHVGLEYHLSQAPDEMQQLARELKELVDRAGLPVPAIRKVLGSRS